MRRTRRERTSRRIGRGRGFVGLLAGVVGLGLTGAPTARAAAPATPAAPKANAAATRPAEGPPRTWHATAYVSGAGVNRIIQYWSSGPSMRAETLVGGHPVATIVNGSRYLVIDRLAGKGLDIERAPRAIAADKTRTRPFAFEHEEIRAAGGEKVEEKPVAPGGPIVEIWRVTDKSGRHTAWVSKAEPHVPLRVENFVRGSSQTIETVYSQWGIGLEMPDAFFQLPPGTEVERYSYADFMKAIADGRRDPADILYPDLLHGPRER